MLNISKLYYRYILTKQVMIILILINLFYSLSLIYSSGIFDGYSYMDMYRIDYSISFHVEFFIITKMITVIISVFIITMLFREASNHLATYIIDKRFKKFDLVMSKYFVAISISIIFISSLFGIYFLITYFFTPYSLIKSEYIDLFLAVLVQNLTYISMTFLLMSIFSNILVSLVPIVIYWFMEVNPLYNGLEVNGLSEVMYKYIPNPLLIEETNLLMNYTIGYLIFNFITVCSAILININKDIN